MGSGGINDFDLEPNNLPPNNWNSGEGISDYTGGDLAKTLVMVYHYPQTWGFNLEVENKAGNDIVCNGVNARNEDFGVCDLAALTGGNGVDYRQIEYREEMNGGGTNDY